MELINIEPTPSPHTMKLILKESLHPNVSHHVTAEQKDQAPGLLRDLLEIEGVKGYYHVADFIALERFPKANWETILSEVKQCFGELHDEAETDAEQAEPDEHYGEIRVYLQMFRGIPMQIKLDINGEEKRVGLPERFMNAIMEAQKSSDNMIMERQWVEQTPRYGDPSEIEQEVAEEIAAAYDQKRLETLVEEAFQTSSEKKETPFKKVTIEQLDNPDWRERYRALDRMEPTMADLPILEKALHDQKVSIRRLAVVYFGMLEDDAALPYLFEGLKDKTVTVRRTAGDCLSDLGSPLAIPEMIRALEDPSKIVRWRAAMFLYETGDETAIEALKAAQDDPEFEVALQVKMALSRIEGGEDAKGSVWKQMTESRQKS